MSEAVVLLLVGGRAKAMVVPAPWALCGRECVQLVALMLLVARDCLIRILPALALEVLPVSFA